MSVFFYFIGKLKGYGGVLSNSLIIRRDMKNFISWKVEMEKRKWI